MSSNAALLFQGAIGVIGLVAILLFGIPVLHVGPGLWPSILLGTVGAALTYAVLLLLTRVPGLFPENLERQMEIASQNLEFEKAADLRDEVELLKRELT